MIKGKYNDCPLENARKYIDIILTAYKVTDALIIIGNDNEYQGEVFGNENRIAKNIKISMEQNNLVRSRIEKIIKILTL